MDKEWRIDRYDTKRLISHYAGDLSQMADGIGTELSDSQRAELNRGRG
jgi:hypothetical protein